MKIIIAVFLSIFVFGQVIAANPAQAITPEKKKAIAELVELSGGANMAKQISNVMINAIFRQLGLGKSDKQKRIIGVMKEELDIFFKDVMPKIMDSMVPIYDKYYSLGEIKDIIRFYKTPTGRKLVRVLPKLMQDSSKASSIIMVPMMQQVMQKIKARLKKEGLVKK